MKSAVHKTRVNISNSQHQIIFFPFNLNCPNLGSRTSSTLITLKLKGRSFSYSEEIEHQDFCVNPQVEMGSSFQGLNRTGKMVYRDILKAVTKHIGKEEHKSHFIDFVKQEFRNNINSENPQKLKLAYDYAVYLNSVHHHKDLLFSYNIAVDRSDEMKRTLGKSAASVGLQLPDVYQS